LRKIVKPIEFRTPALGPKGKPLVLIVTPQCVAYREMRSKQSFPLTHERVHLLGVQAEAESNRTRFTVKRGNVSGG
jgi:hypothetical protein